MIQNRTRMIWKKCDKRNSHISSESHLIYISSNNDRHSVTKTFTPLHYTCRHFTSFHFKLHPTTRHSTSLHLSTLHFFPFKLHSSSLHYTLLPSHLAVTQRRLVVDYRRFGTTCRYRLQGSSSPRRIRTCELSFRPAQLRRNETVKLTP